MRLIEKIIAFDKYLLCLSCQFINAQPLFLLVRYALQNPLEDVLQVWDDDDVSVVDAGGGDGVASTARLYE